MGQDLFTSTLNRSIERDLSVLELVQAIETLKPTTEPAKILSLYESWTEHNQDNPLLYAVYFNYSVALSDNGDLAGARDKLERAIAVNPDFMPSYINLGRIFERQGQAGQAVLQWSAMNERLAQVTGGAIGHKTTALNQMARVLEAGNQDTPAETMLRQSLDLDCRQWEAVQHFLALRQRQCEWPVVAPWERADRQTLMAGMSPLSLSAYSDDPMLQLASAWNYNKRDVGIPATPPVSSYWSAVEGHRSGPLRIGYLSSDLREHAVGHLMAEMFGLHDRNAVEVFAYYCGIPADDPLHHQFKDSADHWVSISHMDDAAAARRIADDGIQILVDVNGYTREGRTKLLALRPAPVIVNWLGYPGTLGSPYHHYIIADDWIIPEGQEIYYSEKVLRIPCYQPNDRRRAVSDRQFTRQELGLPENGAVYCCFNGTHKITRFTFDRWLTILSRVPGSVLWLLSSTETAQERLRLYAVQHGIAAERLIFADKMPNAEHLARYPLADLFLDTAPYGAHTTASDALWMGVPVLTLNGRSFATRVCGSLVRSVGLPELICATPEEYVDRAVALGRDETLLGHYRDTLRAGRESSVLFDTPLLVRSLETQFRVMWDEFLAGKRPRPDLANLDVYFEVGIETDPEAVEVQAIRDYEAWWQEKLAARHRMRPIPADERLWSPQCAAAPSL